MIDTTIEDKLFREFKYGGAAYLALEYVNIAHKKDGFDVYPKNWQEFYKIKLPQIVKSRTDSYDDVPLFVRVDGERPLRLRKKNIFRYSKCSPRLRTMSCAMPRYTSNILKAVRCL